MAARHENCSASARHCARGMLSARLIALPRSMSSAPETPSRRMSLGPATGKAATGDAACQGLEDHQTECVGEARKDEDISRGIEPCQILAHFLAEEDGPGKARFQIGMLRPIADHDLAAGQVQPQEGLDILLDSEASNT